MTSTTKFPRALTRRDSLGPAEGSVRRKGPSAKEVAMMDSQTYKQYAQRRGEWPCEAPDRSLENPDSKEH